MLDTAVKLSQISLPILVLIIGYFVNRGVQTHGLNIKLVSEFNTKWSEQFISKCMNFSESISKLQFLMFDYGKTGKLETSAYNILISQIAEEKYLIETHASLVDEGHPIIETIDRLFDCASKNALALKDGGFADFEKIKEMQRKLHKQLRDMQRSVLKLGTTP